MCVLTLILARAGSKGLTGKNHTPLLGRPLCAYTLDDALASRRAGRVVVSTDSPEVAAHTRGRGVEVLDRPPDLASDTATVDAAARDALARLDGPAPDTVVILYANVPLRPPNLIDDAVGLLERTGCDYVQSLCRVGKAHPAWMKGLDGDRLLPNPHYTGPGSHRRQDLPPLYQLDGGVLAVTATSLTRTDPTDPHAFLGTDRRAVVTQEGSVIDIDTPLDLVIAEAVLRQATSPHPSQERGDAEERRSGVQPST